MPNHVHGIIIVGANDYSPLPQSSPPPRGTSKTIGSIVRGFKIGVTKWIRANTSIHEVWQRNYWERIIRSDEELNGIREYIQNNPAQWENDKLYFQQMDATVGANDYSPLPGTPLPIARANDYSPLPGTPLPIARANDYSPLQRPDLFGDGGEEMP